MWCGGRNGKPLGCVRQIDSALQIELGVVAEACHVVGGAIGSARDGEFTAMQRGGSLAGAVGHTHFEIRRVVVIHGHDQRWARLGFRAYVVGKVAPHNIAGRGFCPPWVSHAVSDSNRLERMERLLPCGTRFLI